MDGCDDWCRGGTHRGGGAVSSELLIQVNEHDEFLGYVERSIAHTPGHLVQHREVMTLLFKEPEHIHFLMQKRSSNKDLWPNKWTLSATGHVNKDDLHQTDTLGYIATAKREAPEELGVTPVNLQLVITQEIKTLK